LIGSLVCGSAIAHGLAEAVLRAAGDIYNITALCNILQPKVLTIMICFVLNAKEVFERDIQD